MTLTVAKRESDCEARSLVYWWAAEAAILLGLGFGDDLDHATLRRIGRLARAADRRRGAAAAGLARRAVGWMCATSWTSLVEVRRCRRCGGPHGKPRMAATDVEYSISHSGEIVAVAVSAHRAVGIDIEQSTHASGGDLRDWVAVESVLKATGDGLAVDPRRVGLVRTPGGWQVAEYDGRTLAAQVAAVHPADGYLGAVAVLGSTPVTLVRGQIAD